MHSRHSSSQQAGTNQPSRPAVDPSLLEVKEKGQSNNASSYSNRSCTHDVLCRIDELVVADAKIADVMHTSNSQACDDTRHDQEWPKELLTGLSDLDRGETKEQENDWQKDGQRRKAGIVVKLDL
jgi:hypothetical protein